MKKTLFISTLILAFSFAITNAYSAGVSDEIAAAKKATQAKAEKKVLSIFKKTVTNARLKIVSLNRTTAFTCEYQDFKYMTDCLAVEYRNGWFANYEVKISDGRACEITLWIFDNGSGLELASGAGCFKNAKTVDAGDLEFTETLNFSEL